jgi:hydrogenase-4 component B
MTLIFALSCVAALLATAIVGVLIGRAAVANALIYGLCATAALISLFAALKHLLGAAPAESMVLPLGIPWIGSHFRIDALSAFFLAVVDLGAVTASSRSAMAATRTRHCACCRSIRHSSPA